MEVTSVIDLSTLDAGELQDRLREIENTEATLYLELDDADTEERWNEIKNRIDTYTAERHEIELRISELDSETMGKWNEFLASREPVEIDIRIDEARAEMDSISEAFRDIISFSDRQLSVDIDAIQSAEGLRAVGEQLVTIQETTGLIPEFIIDTEKTGAELDQQLFKLSEIKRYAGETAKLEVDTDRADEKLAWMNDKIADLQTVIEWRKQFGLDTSTAEADVRRLKRRVDELNAALKNRPSSDAGDRGGDERPGYAGGGHVPGTGTGDIVPALLSPGEFVHKIAAVRKYGLPLFRALNNMTVPVEHVRALMSGKLAEMREAVQRFRTGGHVVNTLLKDGVQRFRDGGMVLAPAIVENIRAFDFTPQIRVPATVHRELRTINRVVRPDPAGADPDRKIRVE